MYGKGISHGYTARHFSYRENQAMGLQIEIFELYQN